MLTRLQARLAQRCARTSLRIWLLALVLAAGLPALAVLGNYVVRDQQTQQLQQLQGEDLLARAAATLAQAVEDELTASIDALHALASEDGGPRDAARVLPGLLQGQPLPRRDWDSVFLLDREGRVRFDTLATADDNAATSLRTLHDRVMATGQSAAASLTGPGRDAAPAIAVAIARVQGGAVREVLGARIRNSTWQRLVQSAGYPAGGVALLQDARQRVIARSDRDVAAPQGISVDFGSENRERPFGVQHVQAPGEVAQLVAWQAVPLANASVRVARPAAALTGAQGRSAGVAIGTGIAALGLALLLALALARRLGAGLTRLADAGRSGRDTRPPVWELAQFERALRQWTRHDQAARDRLEARAHALQTLFDSSPVGLAIAQDRAGQQVWHNAAMDRLLGTSAQVLHEGQPLAPAAWPLQRAARGGELVHGLELELAGPDRPSAFVLASAVPLRDEHGRLCGAVCALVDISERKQAEARLHAADGLLRERQRLVEQAQASGEVGFFHHRLGADRMTWSTGQCALFGAALPPGAGMQAWLARIHDEDRGRIERELWTACALRRTRQSLDYRALLPDGGERWLSSRIVLQYDLRGHATELTGVTVDMSQAKHADEERRQAVQRAQQAQQQAETANEAKDALIALLGHELRNPLGAISAAADVLALAPPGSGSAHEARTVIGRQTLQLVRRLDEWLDMNRAIAGTHPQVRVPIDLAALVEQVWRALTADSSARVGKLRFDAQAVWVAGDPARLEQAVRHLIGMALDRRPTGTPVELGVRTAEGMAELMVQAAGAPAAAAGAPGLSLTLARRLVELQGGSVAVDRASTRLTLRLPAIDPPERAEPALLPASRRRKVLVIEDNADVLSALRAKLELDGHSVSTAVDGIAGLDQLLALQPEVSIVDIGLPGLTGYELARHARAAGYAGRLIALSGFGSERDGDSARVAGFDACLVKPVDRQQLRASLNEE